MKDDHGSGPIGRSPAKRWPEGRPSEPYRDVTLALPHALWIILLTGQYEPKKMGRGEEGGEHWFNLKDEQKKGVRVDAAVH